MDIGSLRRRVSLLEYAKEKDEYGGVAGSWQTCGRLWACIDPQGGTESYDNQQVKAINKALITIRYNPRITELNRIQYGEKIYEIESVSDKGGLHKETLLNCKEVRQDGL